MQIQVAIKHPGKRKNTIEKTPLSLSQTPETVGQLITLAVQSCVSSYNTRAAAPSSVRAVGETANQEVLKLLTLPDIELQAATGKVAFGVNYGEAFADLNKALETVRQSFADGLIAVFLEDRELKGWDTPITVHEDARVTFIRMTMLSGRGW